MKGCNARKAREAADAKANGKNGHAKSGRPLDAIARIAKAVDEEVSARVAEERARLEKWAIDESERLFKERVDRVLKDLKP